jgi:hypothetical protein
MVRLDSLLIKSQKADPGHLMGGAPFYRTEQPGHERYAIPEISPSQRVNFKIWQRIADAALDLFELGNSDAEPARHQFGHFEKASTPAVTLAIQSTTDLIAPRAAIPVSCDLAWIFN